MVYNIDQLPDDTISYILSFLTVRDAFRARLSLPRWLHLTDSRSVLQFDSLNVLGKQIADKDKDRSDVQSTFVKIVNCFMETRLGKKIHKLDVKFRIGKEHASHVDRWIANSVNLKVEEIELNFSGVSQERYVFPSHLIQFKNLKRLCLSACTLRMHFMCKSWLSNLTTLDLSNVPLHKWWMSLILSTCSSLTSLHLFYCNLPKYVWIDGQLPRLKKLTIDDTLLEIKLNCPSLEVFECHGSMSSVVFVHVPVLREAKLWSITKTEGCSLLFNHVTRQAPHLQVLSILMKTEVKPVLSTLARCLKELKISVSCAFDLLTVTNMLNSSPFLETLHIQLVMLSTGVASIEKREYCDRSHYNLKQIKIDGFLDKWNEMELAIYLLKNAMALERMVIRSPRRDLCLRKKVASLQKINSTALVIFL